MNNNVSQNSDFIEENRLVITDVANYAAGQTGTTIGSVVQTEATQIANSIVSQAVSDITNVGGGSQQGGSLD